MISDYRSFLKVKFEWKKTFHRWKQKYVKFKVPSLRDTRCLKLTCTKTDLPEILIFKTLAINHCKMTFWIRQLDSCLRNKAFKYKCPRFKKRNSRQFSFFTKISYFDLLAHRKTYGDELVILTFSTFLCFHDFLLFSLSRSWWWNMDVKYEVSRRKVKVSHHWNIFILLIVTIHAFALND